MAAPTLHPVIDQTVDQTVEAPSVIDDVPSRRGYRFFHPRPLFKDVCNDHCNYYRWPNACGYLYSIAGSSLLANTSLDGDFRDWYQRDVRSKDTDNFSSFWKTFGEGKYVVPLFACTAVAGKMLDRFPVADTIGEHGYRTTRAYLVGFPPMLFSQHLLGGSRPTEEAHGSMWRPFNDNNAVSGHSFMGAVPFITAAQMSDHWLMRAGFYTLSTFPAWSRINDDAHYLSQTCLGWYMAYMACKSVSRTDDPDRCIDFFPLFDPSGGVGIMAVWKR